MKAKLKPIDRAFYKLNRERKLEAQGGKCYYCKRPLTRNSATVDHVIPISKCGYRHSDHNTVVACSTCNGNKGAKPVQLFTPDPIDVLMAQIAERIEQRTRLAIWRLDFDPKGSFSKWQKYHIKQGRWKK